MKSKDLKPLKVSLHGMDERMQKMMANYLRLPCRGTAIVVLDDEKAHAEIVDVDLATSETILEDRLKTSAPKPIIALSLNPISKAGVIYVKKPIQVKEVLAAFNRARNTILGKETLESPLDFSDTSFQSTPKKTPDKIQKPTDLKIQQNKDPADFIAEAIKKSQSPQMKKAEQQISAEKKNRAQIEKKLQPSEINQTPENAENTSITQKNSVATEPETPEFLISETAKEPFPPLLPEETSKNEITQEPKHTIKPEKKKTKPVPAPPVHFLKKNKNKGKKTVTEKPNKQTKDITPETAKPAPQLKQETTKPTTSTSTSTSTSKSLSDNKFLSSFWQKKAVFLGAAGLILLIAIVHFFQQTPLYEARARILIGNGNLKNIDLTSPPKTILEKNVIQKKTDEILSKKLAKRVILGLQLGTTPEFIKASDIPNEKIESASRLREERLAAERLSNMVDYFLKNLKVTQYKNHPIINVTYLSEEPELASKIVNRLIEEYLAIQEDKKAAQMTEIAAWENNKLPLAKNKLKQSQDALALYIEMNKWSQFEQQFAEDMGVNSEIRSLEKKVKADQSLYEIMLQRFEKLKNNSDRYEVKLLSSAELPVEPSYPNKPRFIFWSVIIATLFAIILTAGLTVLSLLKKEKQPPTQSDEVMKKAA